MNDDQYRKMVEGTVEGAMHSMGLTPMDEDMNRLGVEILGQIAKVTDLIAPQILELADKRGPEFALGALSAWFTTAEISCDTSIRRRLREAGHGI